MKEVIEVLKELKSDKYGELISALEIQRDTLEDILNEIGRKYLPGSFEERDFARVNTLVGYAEKIDYTMKKLELFIEETFEDEELEDEDFEDGTEEAIRKDYSLYAVNDKIPHNLNENFKRKKPCAFIIEDTRILADHWNRMLIKTCEYLAKKDAKFFDEIVIKEKVKIGNGIKFSLYKSKVTKEYKLPFAVGYMDMQLTANSVKMIIKKLLNIYGIDRNKFTIFLRADFNKEIEKGH